MVQILSVETRSSVKRSLSGMKVRSTSSCCKETSSGCLNPPSGSHFGGVWERCIRTVRKILVALIKEQPLDDEGLTTLICEVEAIVNGRPITKLSDDPSDAESLTPNHLLLLRPGCYQCTQEQQRWACQKCDRQDKNLTVRSSC